MLLVFYVLQVVDLQHTQLADEKCRRLLVGLPSSDALPAAAAAASTAASAGAGAAASTTSAQPAAQAASAQSFSGASGFSTASAALRGFSKEFLDSLPVKALLRFASELEMAWLTLLFSLSSTAEEDQAHYGGLYPPLLSLVTTHYPQVLFLSLLHFVLLPREMRMLTALAVLSSVDAASGGAPAREVPSFWPATLH
jgi:hypothetical protein